MSTKLRIALAAAAIVTVYIFAVLTVGYEPSPLWVVIYFLPTIIALTRWHRDAPAAVMVNVFAGWTIIGWIVALTWACWHKSLKTAIIGPAAAGVSFAALCWTVGFILGGYQWSL